MTYLRHKKTRNRELELLEDVDINEEDIDQGPGPSKWTVVVVIILSFVLFSIGVLGYGLWKDYMQTSAIDFSFPSKSIPADYKNYSNKYWGFNLRYPGSWSQPIGSYESSVFYFASETISFAEELSKGEALIIIKGYNNNKRLSFEDWLTYQENTYFPHGTTLLKEPSDVQGLPAKHYIIEASYPDHNQAYLDLYAVSRDYNTKYEFILATSDQKTHDKFLPKFQTILSSLEFVPGFGLEDNHK